MESNFKKTTDSLFSGMENFITTKTVVGDAISIDGTIIVPLVDVSFGVGAGAIEGTDEKGSKDSGVGAMGAKITPSAVLVIQGASIRMVSVKEVEDGLSKFIDMAPGIIDKIKTMMSKDKTEEKSSI